MIKIGNTPLLGLLVLAIALQTGCASSGQSRLKRRIDHYSGLPGLEFQFLCGEIEVPCGFQHRANESLSKDPLVLNGKTGEEILAQILHRFGDGYSFAFDRGVLNVVPVTESPSILDSRLSSFDMDHEPMDVAVDKLNIRLTGASPGKDAMEGTRHMRAGTIHLRNISAREGLNSIVRADGAAVWQFFPATPKFQPLPAISIQEYDRGH